MHSQLTAIACELDAASQRARDLAQGLTPGQWGRRIVPQRWSIGENIVHLNLTSEKFLELIPAAVHLARSRGLTGAPPFRRDFMGWLLGKMIEPPYRIKVKTAPAFIPQATMPAAAALAQFEDLQEKLKAQLHAAQGLDFARIRVASPFSQRVSYNLYSTLRLIPSHQRHHLWAAEGLKALLRKSS